ncbi:MAG: electron transfer flavoprotein subunit beta/FixA family protein [Chloroflexota bacterium]|nr:electron transfer flavoprotein subunit beta/FixA family protein [Chloroflexota bacterium]
MNIIVCVKQVLDPDIPPAKFKVNSEAKQVVPPEGIPPVINPYDAQAVELALRLKERNGGKITVLTAGGDGAEKVVKHAISMGADDGFVLNDAAFEGSDSFGAAYILTKAIQKIGEYDLVLCGRQAADWDEGLVGSIIAENLSSSLVILAEDAELVEEGLKVKRVTLDGYQVFVVPTPAVVTVSNEVGQARLPSGLGIISAARRQIPVWKAADIDVDPAQVGAAAARRKLLKLFIPARERKCELVEGETTAEAAAKLAEKLREARII